MLTDERLAELIGAAKRSNYVLYVLCDGTSDALDALVELRDRRAADSPAPKAEPKLPKWARRLAEMRATLECELLSGGGLRWWCNVWEYHTGMPANYSGKTKQAAVKAAWRAWKEARRDA